MLTFDAWRGRGAASRAERARRRLDDGDLTGAATDAERAASDAAAAGDVAVAHAAAEVWLAALAAAGRGDERAAAAERLRGFGVSGPAILSALAAHAALVLRRVDPAALEVYVEALETGALKDPAVKKGVLRVLAVGLYVGMDEAPSRFDGRAALLERMLASFPGTPFVRLYLGRYEYLRGRFVAAKAHLSAVGGRAAASPKTLNLLGRAAEKTGAVDEALAAYAASLAADRRQAAVHFRLGRLLLARWVDAAERP